MKLMNVHLIMSKKIFFIVIFIAAILNQLSLAHEYTNVSGVDEASAVLNSQPSIMPDYDSMIKNYVSKMNHEYVKYSDGEVMFFANPSTMMIALNIFIALGGTVCGLGLLGGGGMLAYDSYTHGTLDPKFLAALALLATIPVGLLCYGVYTGVQTVKQIAAKLSTVPYVTFSKEGLFCYNKHQFNWNQLAKIDVTTFITRNQYRAITDMKVVATMKDRFGKKLFEVSSEILSIDLAVFAQCAEYYRQQSLYQEAMSN